MKKKLIVIIGILVLLAAGFPTAVKIYLERRLSSELHGKFTIKKISIFFPGLAISKAEFTSDYAVLAIPEIKVQAGFNRSPSRLTVIGLDLKLLDLKKISTMFSSKKPTSPASPPIKIFPLEININDMSLSAQAGTDLSIDAKFSFSGMFAKSGALPRVDDFNLESFNFTGNDAAIVSAKIEKTGIDEYLLTIGQLRIKDKKISDMSLPFRFQDAVLSFDDPGDFFKLPGLVNGAIYLNELPKIKADLRVVDMDAQGVLAFLAKDAKDIIFTGKFGGAGDFEFTPPDKIKIGCELSNVQGGKIHIEEEDTLQPLKQNLSERNYNILIEGFKNYEYNKGIIKLNTEENNTIGLTMEFDSKKMGRRYIPFYYHLVIDKP